MEQEKKRINYHTRHSEKEDTELYRFQHLYEEQLKHQAKKKQGEDC